jgi:hypothetical protein
MVTKSAEPNTMRLIHAETGMVTGVIDVLLPLLLSGEEGDDEDGSANISDPEILIFLIKCFCLTTYEY